MNAFRKLFQFRHRLPEVAHAPPDAQWRNVRSGSARCSDHLIDFPRVFCVDRPDLPVQAFHDPIVRFCPLRPFEGADRDRMR